MAFSNDDLKRLKERIAFARRSKALIFRDPLKRLLKRLKLAEAVIESSWEHVCSDKVGGCTAISATKVKAWRKAAGK